MSYQEANHRIIILLSCLSKGLMFTPNSCTYVDIFNVRTSIKWFWWGDDPFESWCSLCVSTKANIFRSYTSGLSERLKVSDFFQWFNRSGVVLTDWMSIVTAIKNGSQKQTNKQRMDVEDQSSCAVCCNSTYWTNNFWIYFFDCRYEYLLHQLNRYLLLWNEYVTRYWLIDPKHKTWSRDHMIK